MRIKRLLAVLLTAVLVSQLVPQTALAEVVQSGDTDRTYNYVAIGDSTTAGVNLEPSATPGAKERAVILSKALLANPIQEAFPALIGEELSVLGDSYNFVTSATNLGTTGYSASDVAHTIREEGYRGEYMSMLLGAGTSKDKSAKLAKYHKFFEYFLPKADLVSIEVGGNDLWMNSLMPLLQDSNPVVRIFAYAITRVLAGDDVETIEENIDSMILLYKKDITSTNVYNGLKVLLKLSVSGSKNARTAAANVKDVILAVKEINPDADIAVMGFYNPYENPNSREELDNKMETVINYLLTKLIKAATGSSRKTALRVYAQKAATKLLVKFTGAANEATILTFNSYVQTVARKQGVTYVDIMGVDTGDDGEPHPTAEGHRQIADRLWNAMSGKIAEKMASVSEPEPEPEAVVVSESELELQPEAVVVSDSQSESQPEVVVIN